MMSMQYCYGLLILEVDPPATAGGTDLYPSEMLSFEAELSYFAPLALQSLLLAFSGCVAHDSQR